MIRTYQFTTFTPQLGYTDAIRNTIVVDGRDRVTFDGRLITRAAAATHLRFWRLWARSCPDQELDVQRSSPEDRDARLDRAAQMLVDGADLAEVAWEVYGQAG